MLFALPRCRQGQPPACKAWFRPCVINLGSESFFLSRPWLFLLAERSRNTSHPGQQPGNGTSVLKTQHRALPSLQPHEQEPKSPLPAAETSKRQWFVAKLPWEFVVGGEDSKFPLLPLAPRRMFHP